MGRADRGCAWRGCENKQSPDCNKSDCDEAEIEVSVKEAEELAKKHDMDFFLTSAKTGHNVEESFENIAVKIVDDFKEREAMEETMPAAAPLRFGNRGNSTRSKCC